MTSHEQLDALYEQDLIVFPQRPGGQPMYKQYVGPGVPYQDIWAYQPNTRGVLWGSDEHIDQDVKWLEAEEEKLGFETQKPVGLLERIIRTSSNAREVVLDPFCGCGTTVVAAEKLGRRWIGIDITYVAVDLVRRRLEDIFGDKVRIAGIPRDIGAAADLFRRSPFDFERWAVSLVSGQPNQKQVGDRGIDGVIRFRLSRSGQIGRCLVSVKGGQQNHPSFVRDLLGAVSTQGAEMGLLITMAQPTRGMTEAANHAGSYVWPFNNESFPKIQLATVQDLLSGHRPSMPPVLTPYLTAPRQARPVDQLRLGGH